MPSLFTKNQASFPGMDIMITARKVYRFISSMKTGLVLLGLIGLASAVGSGLMPDTFFRTLPFKLLLLLLFLNMASCTINRLSGYLKKNSKGSRKNRSRLREFGILLLHTGIVLVLIGGTIYAYFGQSGEISLAEGDTVDMSSIIRTENPFLLRLNKFEIVYYPDGSPSQYYSYVSILDGSKETKRCRISVNHPLQHAGIKAYQQNFGYLVEVEGNNGRGEKVAKILKEGEFINIPDTERTVKVFRYIPNFDPKYGMNTKTLRPDNPRIIYSVYEKGSLLGVGAASPGKSIQIDKGCYVKFKGIQPYTVLKVKSDPGLPLAAASGLMLMAGVTLTVFFNPGKRGKKTAAENGEPGEPGGAVEETDLSNGV